MAVKYIFITHEGVSLDLSYYPCEDTPTVVSINGLPCTWFREETLYKIEQELFDRLEEYKRDGE